MRRVISLILVISFGIPSLFGMGLHALMPHGAGGSSHIHTMSLTSCVEVQHECSCDSSHEHESFHSEHALHSECDSVAPGASWQGCRGFACHDADCVICFFCMSHKTAFVFSASAVTNTSVVRLFLFPEVVLEQVRIYTPCGRGPPLAAELYSC